MHALTTYFIKIRFNIILPLTLSRNIYAYIDFRINNLISKGLLKGTSENG
jgi:hypothetical protein